MRPYRSFALAAALVALVGARAAPSDGWNGRDEELGRIAAPAFPDRAFPVVQFGAVGDGRTDCREAFARAIAACRDAGGGHVLVSAGAFFCDGPIRLESNVDLHLERGAVIRFGADPARYFPLVLTRYEGTLYYGQSPRIYAYGATRIAITGEGTIDGNGRATLDLVKARHWGGNPAELRRLAAEGVPVEKRIFGTGRWLRANMIEPFDCTGVLIEGVTLRDSTMWVVHPALCRNVTVRGIKVDSMNPNNDGCDPDSSSDVLIEDCDFHTGDDAIAIKSGRDSDAWRVGRPSEGIVIRRCRMTAHWGGVCIGSEMSGGVRNVWIEDCRMGSVSSAFYFKANLDRGGFVERVWARRIQVDRVRAAVVRFETGYHGYAGGQHPPSFSDFAIEDVRCHQSGAYGIYLDGVSAAPIRNVAIVRTVVDSAPAPLWLRHLDGVEFEDVRIDGVLEPSNPLPTPAGEQKLKIDG